MKKRCIWGALLAVSLVHGAQAGNEVKIAVRVVNSAQAPDDILAGGEKQAAFVLKKAGIEVVWKGCSAGTYPEPFGAR